ncbi:MAG: cell envelope integrity EipB family protein [Rhodoblastus sp.]|nr:cell envelope integrity EipB family protein [Rhodoblastus sp.]
MTKFAVFARSFVMPLTVAPLVLAAGAAQAAGPSLASHRAVYELTLLSSKGDKAPNTARGRIAFDFSGNACDGYTQNFRQMTELQPPEGPARLSDMRTATFEDASARNFRFKVESKVDNRGVEQIDGAASKSGDGALSVRLVRPQPSRLDLDQDVVFPTEHIVRIIEAAKAGQKMLALKAFDGSDTGRKVFQTLTIIGKETSALPSEKAAQAAQLKNLKRWPVTISYFEEDKKDNAPNYVLSFDLYENGVSRALKLDYGDFVLAGEMKQLEFLPAKPCKK